MATKEPKRPAAVRQAGSRAPLLLETAYAVSFSIIVLAGIVTAGLSVWSGVPAWLVAVRAGLAVVVLGLVLWTVNYRLMHGAFEAAMSDRREQTPAGQPPASTQEWKA
jgi:protein-S-isoprenylcysteine O-methyltransferase Ste14